MYITNAFSINMLDKDVDVSFKKITVSEAAKYAKDAISAVGHEDTAAIFSNILSVAIQMNRISIQLDNGVIVGQYSGPRLPEGAKTLPEGATIQWWLVRNMNFLVDTDCRRRYNTCIS